MAAGYTADSREPPSQGTHDVADKSRALPANLKPPPFKLHARPTWNPGGHNNLDDQMDLQKDDNPANTTAKAADKKLHLPKSLSPTYHQIK